MVAIWWFVTGGDIILMWVLGLGLFVCLFAMGCLGVGVCGEYIILTLYCIVMY